MTRQASDLSKDATNNTQSPPISQIESQKSLNKPSPTYNQSLKQRINNLVLKTLQENTGRDRQTLLNPQYNDTWKTRLFQNTRVICSPKECQMVTEDIMNRVSRPTDDATWPFTSEKVVVAFDCEGINIGIKGQLTLMQIATMTGFSYVFDLISCPQMIDYGLKKLLESPDVVKVSKHVLYLFIIRNRNKFANKSYKSKKINSD